MPASSTSLYHIDDITLAASGQVKIDIARANMVVLNKLVSDETPNVFIGRRVALSLHVTKDVGVLAQALKHLGVDVMVVASFDYSIQSDVAAALVESDCPVWAWKDQYDINQAQQKVLDFKPDIIVDDGTALIPKAIAANLKLMGAIEGSKVVMKSLTALPSYPLMDASTSTLRKEIGSRYGGAQSIVNSIVQATGILVGGKTVVVAGYGHSGREVAMLFANLGARVVVTEIDPIKAVAAQFDGFKVEPMAVAVGEGDVFVCCTGMLNTLQDQHLQMMKDGAIVACTGPANTELPLAMPFSVAAPKLEKIKVGDKNILLLARTAPVNLAAGDGYPPEVMDLMLAQGLQTIIGMFKGKYQGGVQTLSLESENELALLKLKATNTGIDILSSAQIAYASAH